MSHVFAPSPRPEPMTALPRTTLAPTPPAATPRPGVLERAIHAPDTPFTRWLVRWRRWFFAGLVLLTLIQFNGQWRIGLDSAIYRGVGESIAAGRGYTFPIGHRQNQVYPGLPAILAVFEKAFGTSLVPALILLNACAIATLAGVYQLVKRHYPLWIAVSVTCGVGMNARFLLLTQEVMTDVPFLCAVVWAMVAWDRLGEARGRGRIAVGIVGMALCLLAAASMRPTFWVLAVAWGLSAAWNVVRRREKRSMVALAVLAMVLGLFMLLDPRSRGIGLVQGAYEKQLWLLLPDLAERLKGKLFKVEIPEAFFNEALWGAGYVFSAFLLLGTLLVTRRQPMWGLQVFILTALMLALSDTPRYYLMVLPTLWIGYVLAILLITASMRPVLRDVALFGLFSLANFQNLGGALSLFVEQHSRPFVEKYKNGDEVPDAEMAALLKRRLDDDDVVIGPRAQVLAYLSGKQVLNGRLIGMDAAKPSKYADVLAATKPGYIIGPLSQYHKKDRDLEKLIARGVVVPGRLVARTKDLWLAEAAVNNPAGDDWRQRPVKKVFPLGPPKQPRVQRSAEEIRNRQIKSERAERARLIAHKKLKAERAERAAKLERKRIRLERERRKQAATQPAALAPSPVVLNGRGLG